MKGIIFKTDNENEAKKDSLNLLMSHKKMEVVLGEIEENDGFYISSYEDEDIIEFVYILEGQVQFADEGEIMTLKKGDYLYHNHLESSFTMYATEKTKILTFSNTGDFDEVEEQLNKLYKVLDEIEEKDNYTKGHCMRVGLYAQKLANRSNKKIKFMRELVIAANLHDVGKCMIPDEVLLKGGKFTDEERKVMMNHSKYTYELLKNGFGMGEVISMIAACHHERVDGSGYPFGLCGNEIPIESRIIAIVDTFDAITTNRPYQEGKNSLEALNEMCSFSSGFDLELFEIFRELVLENELDIREME